jgi:hypothetical protein
MKTKLDKSLRENINIWSARDLDDSPVQIIQFTNMLGQMSDADVVEWTEDLYQDDQDKYEVFKLWKFLNKRIGEFQELEPPF